MQNPTVKGKSGNDTMRDSPTAPTFCALLASAHGCSFDEATGLLTLRGGPWDGHCVQETRPRIWELVPASIWHAA